MTGKTHALAGACTALIMSATGAEAVIAIFGALLPDVDSSTSMVGRYAKPIAKIFPHRGPTHSIIMLALCFIISPWLALGAATHLLLDMLTDRGIMLFWPISKNIRLPFAKYNSTDSLFEKIFQTVLLAVIAIYCIAASGTVLLPEAFRQWLSDFLPTFTMPDFSLI